MAEILSYRKEWAPYFKQLNMDWLEKYFVAEPYDIEVLSNPKKYILDKGGNIYFIAEDGIPKGTVALMNNEYGELELTKMGVDESVQGKGYGGQLIQHCIDEAKKLGAEDLILYSNTKLFYYKNNGRICCRRKIT
jgi:GNAT superfamily N-acetyltransferase